MKEWIVIGALAGLLWASQAWPQSSYRFSSIKQPGAVDTIATATNDASTHGLSGGMPTAGPEYRQQMAQQFQTWWEIMGTALAA
jgi:hypothetical protein